MPTANSVQQLETMLRSHLRNAMSIAASKAEADMFGRTGEFYTQGSPVRYERTGNLGSSPKTTAVMSAGNDISFEAYLDDSWEYTTGTFSTNEAFAAAENHTEGVLGKPHFWKNAKKDIEKSVKNTIRQFCS